MTIGSDVNDLPAGYLRMHIIETTCTRCGHQWTHSEIWGRRHDALSYFHYENEKQLERPYTFTAPIPLARKVDGGCFKCLPLAIRLEPNLTIGTPPSTPLPSPSPSLSPRSKPLKPKLTLEDL